MLSEHQQATCSKSNGIESCFDVGASVDAASLTMIARGMSVYRPCYVELRVSVRAHGTVANPARSCDSSSIEHMQRARRSN